MDVTLENPEPTGTEGARRRQPLNLSGKRTEVLFIGENRCITVYAGVTLFGAAPFLCRQDVRGE